MSSEHAELNDDEEQQRLDSELWGAAYDGRQADVQRLLEEGATVDCRDILGRNALHIACVRRHVDVISELLRNNNGLVNVPDTGTSRGFTPLHYACVSGRVEIFNVLVKNSADLNAKDQLGLTPLHRACQQGHIAMVVRIAMEESADVNAADTHGLTPLHYACRHGHADASFVLIRSGGDINSKSCTGFAPLHSASFHGRLEVVLLLIRNKADVTLRANDGWTPLLYASHNGHVDVVCALIDRGHARIETEDRFHATTSLHSASSNGHDRVVQALLTRGALIDLRNKDGETALDVAKRMNKSEVVDVIKEFITNRYELVQWLAADDGGLAIIQRVLQGGLADHSELVQAAADEEGNPVSFGCPLNSLVRNKMRAGLRVIRTVIRVFRRN